MSRIAQPMVSWSRSASRSQLQPVVAEVTERDALDEPHRGREILDALSASCLALAAKPPEEVDINKHVLDPIRPHTPRLPLIFGPPSRE